VYSTCIIYTCVGKVSNFKQFRTYCGSLKLKGREKKSEFHLEFRSFFYSSYIINIIHTLLVYMKMSQSSDENNASVYDKVYCT